MTHNRFARSRGDGDISADDAPRLWLALLGVTLCGSFFALLMVADLIFRQESNSASTRPAPANSEEPRAVAVGKSDPLPMVKQIVPAPPSASDDLEQANTIAVVAPPAPLAAATDDDIKQAEAERHRRRDICPKGRTYYMKGGYQYWRCNR